MFFLFLKNMFLCKMKNLRLVDIDLILWTQIKHQNTGFSFTYFQKNMTFEKIKHFYSEPLSGFKRTKINGYIYYIKCYENGYGEYVREKSHRKMSAQGHLWVFNEWQGNPNTTGQIKESLEFNFSWNKKINFWTATWMQLKKEQYRSLTPKSIAAFL